MRKRDINGNTVSTSERKLYSIVKNMEDGKYQMDGVGYILVDTSDGGHITTHVISKLKKY